MVVVVVVLVVLVVLVVVVVVVVVVKLPEAFWNILEPSGASLELPEHPEAS